MHSLPFSGRLRALPSLAGHTVVALSPSTQYLQPPKALGGLGHVDLLCLAVGARFVA